MSAFDTAWFKNLKMAKKLKTFFKKFRKEIKK